MTEPAEPDLARLGSALAHPVRVASLEALLGGRWLTSGELARRASVAPSSATDHLAGTLGVRLTGALVAGGSPPMISPT